MKILSHKKILKKYSVYIKKINIGECVLGNEKNLSQNSLAHAHPREGIICFSKRKFFTKAILLHETAHLIRGNSLYNEGHDQKWLKILYEIGARVDRSYLEDNFLEI